MKSKFKRRTKLFSENHDVKVIYVPNKVLPKGDQERWFSPMDRTLRRELKSQFVSHWFDTTSMKELIDLKIKYLATSPEKKIIQDKFDVILNLEVIEHVENVDLFMMAATDLLKKNGIMFIATINRTLESYIKAIVGAEYVLRWLPIGTHDWQKFLTPNEIEQKFSKLNLDKLDLTGLKFNLFSNNWARSKDCSVNYILLAKKN